MDVWHKFVKALDHGRYKFVGILIAGIAAIGLIGCQPKTSSVLNPGEKVDRTQLTAEAATLQARYAADAAKIEAGFIDIEQQAAMRAQIVEVLGGAATAAATGGITTPSAIGTVVTLLSLGLAGGGVVDGARKNKVIQEKDRAIASLNS